MSETVNSKKDNVTIYHRHSESLRIYLYRFVCVCECACVFGICSSDGLSAVTIFFVPMCVQQTTLAVCLLAFETKVFEGLEVRSWSTSYRCHVWCSSCVLRNSCGQVCVSLFHFSTCSIHKLMCVSCDVS